MKAKILLFTLLLSVLCGCGQAESTANNNEASDTKQELTNEATDEDTTEDVAILSDGVLSITCNGETYAYNGGVYYDEEKQERYTWWKDYYGKEGMDISEDNNTLRKTKRNSKNEYSEGNAFKMFASDLECQNNNETVETILDNISNNPFVKVDNLIGYEKDWLDRIDGYPFHEQYGYGVWSSSDDEYTWVYSKEGKKIPLETLAE